MKLRILVLLTILILVPVSVPAQEDAPGPVTWIAFSRLQPGKTAEDAAALMTADKEFMDGLVANGTIMSYGAVTPINHDPDDDWNYAEFVTAESWEKIGAWVGAFMGYVNGLDEKERKERRAASEETHVPGSHYDQVVRHVKFEPGTVPPRFLYLAHFTAEPGKGNEVGSLFDDFVKPALADARASGDMGSIGVYVPEVHGERGYSHVFWYALSDLGSIDTMQSAFAGSAGPGVESWARSVLGGDTHFDKILLVLRYAGPETGPE